MQYKAKVKAEALIHPSEDTEKVTRCLENIFPKAEIRVEENWKENESISRVIAETHSVESIRDQINQQRINNSMEKELRSSVVGDTISFNISKQPAYIGRINIDIGGHELGDISIRIETDNPLDLIEYITTED